jgi:hypothetical protein
MPKGTGTANDIVALYYNATPIANVADNAASSPNTTVAVRLHNLTGPGAGGGQNTNETTYAGYAAVTVARTTGGWAAPSGGATNNVAAIDFPQCTGAGDTITYVSTGKSASGAGRLWHFGALTSTLAVSNLIQPRFAAAALSITES